MSRSLSKEEIEERLIQLRNLEALHEAQRFKIWHLRDDNRALKQKVKVLETTVTAQQKTIDDLKLQMEELRTMVFGKKRRNDDAHGDDFSTGGEPPLPRTSASYRRNPPPENEITEERTHLISSCASCGGEFTERKRCTYFEEDIPLPQKKIVIRHVIEKGWCATCRTWSAGTPLPPAPVILGENVQRYISYLNVVCRQSYSQIEGILQQGYDFDISQGEIAKILEREGNRLRPAYERLKAKIRGEPSIHLDETGWNILGNGERGFAWTMAGGVSEDAVFALGKSRGRGNAEDLIGDSEAVRVTDDYPAYRNLGGDHQLCCAHILRKLRDLAASGALPEPSRAHCVRAYGTFAAIYADVETARTSSDPTSAYDALHERLQAFAEADTRDPAKLGRIKTQVRERSENYLTCLRHPNVAADNNAAERSLRHLVIKRKISFGSMSEGTAETMAILLSVLMSRKQRGELRKYLAGA